MNATVSKWGNSLALRLPKGLTTAHHIVEGSSLEIHETREGILLKPKPRDYDLDDMLNQVTPQNLHRSIDTDSPVGKESW